MPLHQALKQYLSPWFILVSAIGKLIWLEDQTAIHQEKARLLYALGLLNYLEIYAFLDDLPWWFL
ncbi:hypothetical protein RIF25_07575 [Thermosynechococcaceae cyanobacterium BACA0444]|uniref:Uncharacterized protein n=1 Tax=Pseudocalidococcus azoricus BACA0444 TaxID=2918990 RepID=A0AAE4JVT0_9CYAN|nr:hypothetical protein [Pseudocalidococcus azoricus]MDS3860670.1 hypothetical protein [Pseudocalidococcus azoricus BACA0444]